MRSFITKKRANRFLAMLLACLTVLTAAPLGIFAAGEAPQQPQQQTPSVTTTLGTTAFKAGEAAEFDVTTSGITTNKNVRLKFTVAGTSFASLDYEQNDGTKNIVTKKNEGTYVFDKSKPLPKFSAKFDNSGEYKVSVTVEEYNEGVAFGIGAGWESTNATVTKTAYVSDACDLSINLEENAYFVVNEDKTETNEVKNSFVLRYANGTGVSFNICAINGTVNYKDISVENGEYKEVSTDNPPKEFGDATASKLESFDFKAVFTKPGEQALKLVASIGQPHGEQEEYTFYLPVTVYERAPVEFKKASASVAYGATLNIAELISNKDATATYTYAAAQGVPFTVDDKSLLTPTGIGKSTVTVTRDADANYACGTATLEVEVTKGTQTVSFEKASYDKETNTYSMTVTSGCNGEITAKSNRDGVGITYSVEDNNIDKILTVSEGGLVSFTGNTGSATVTATATSDLYEDATATCTVTVEPSTVKTGYTIEGSYHDEPTSVAPIRWYTGMVTIKADTGYKVSLTNGEFSDSITLDIKDGTYDVQDAPSFFLKRDGGKMASKVVLQNFHKDTTAPNAEIRLRPINIENQFVNKILTFISLICSEGQNYEEKKDFLREFFFIAEDKTSGIAKVEYFIDSNTTELIIKTNADTEKEELDIATLETKKWDEVTKEDNYYSIHAPAADSTFVLYVRVTDNAGHTTYASTNGVVFDSTKSGIEFGELTSVSPTGKHGDATVYTGDVTVPVTVEDITSGIKDVKYWVVPDGTLANGVLADASKTNATQSGTLYEFTTDNPA